MGSPYDAGVSELSKREVRRHRRAQRREVAAARDLSADGALLVHHVLDLLAEHHLPATNGKVGSAGTVTLYESLEVEPPTEQLLRALQGAGFRVLLPITLPDLDLDWFAADDPERTPLGKDAIADADLVLTPGLSVDGNGIRLGQGGGCYDKALPRRAPGTKVHTLLHPEELSEHPLPHEEHDVPVDGVVTAHGRHGFAR